MNLKVFLHLIANPVKLCWLQALLNSIPLKALMSLLGLCPYFRIQLTNSHPIRFTDDAIETYKKTPYFKLSEGSEDFLKKYDMFSSKEPSKYPGYMKYKTRAKSFNGAVQWMEVKKEEFAKYGFLYHGMIDLI